MTARGRIFESRSTRAYLGNDHSLRFYVFPVLRANRPIVVGTHAVDTGQNDREFENYGLRIHMCTYIPDKVEREREKTMARRHRTAFMSNIIR